MQAWFTVLAVLLGAETGSAALCACDRWSAGRFSTWILGTGCFCEGCGRRLGFLESRPLLGYMLLRGRCRGCGQRFGRRYLVAEVVGGCAAVWLLAALLGPTFGGRLLPAVLATLVLLAFLIFDLRDQPARG